MASAAGRFPTQAEAFFHQLTDGKSVQVACRGIQRDHHRTYPQAIVVQRNVNVWSIPILIGVGMFISCKNALDRVAAVEVAGTSPPERIAYEAEYLYTDSGVVRNRLRAGRIYKWADPSAPR